MEKNKKMYFNEKEMNLQIQNYNLNNDCKSFDYICNNLSNIINGMINKEFARNTIVKNNIVGTQFHPEFLAHPLRPHPLFNAFVKACLKREK